MHIHRNKGLEKPRFWDLYVQKKTGHKITTQEEHPVVYTILPLISFSVNYSKTLIHH